MPSVVELRGTSESARVYRVVSSSPGRTPPSSSGHLPHYLHATTTSDDGVQHDWLVRPISHTLEQMHGAEGLMRGAQSPPCHSLLQVQDSFVDSAGQAYAVFKRHKRRLRQATTEGDGGALTLERAFLWGRQLLVAIKRLRSCGVVHRDLTLDSVWLTEGDDAVVGGFGLDHESPASHFQAETLGSFQRSIETTLRIALQRWESKVLTVAAIEEVMRELRLSARREEDMWAFGVVMFQLLALTSQEDEAFYRKLSGQTASELRERLVAAIKSQGRAAEDRVLWEPLVEVTCRALARQEDGSPSDLTPDAALHLLGFQESTLDWAVRWGGVRLMVDMCVCPEACPQIRERAMRLLGRTMLEAGQVTALTRVVEHDPRPDAQAAAVLGLGRLGTRSMSLLQDTLAVLLRMLTGADSPRALRMASSKALRVAAGASIGGHSHVVVISTVLSAMEPLCDPTVAPLMRDLLVSLHESVLHAGALPALTRLFRTHHVPAYRMACGSVLLAVAKLEEEAAAEPIAHALIGALRDDTDFEIRVWCCSSLAELGEVAVRAGAIAAFVQASECSTNAPDAKMQHHAAAALKVLWKHHQAATTTTTSQGNGLYRSSSVLGTAGVTGSGVSSSSSSAMASKSGCDLLTSARRGGLPRSRRTFQSLCDLDRHSSGSGADSGPLALIRALKTEADSLKRMNAAENLGLLGPAAIEAGAVGALIASLRNDEANIVRERAAEALGLLAPIARKEGAVEALVGALIEDSDGFVQAYAANALKKLQASTSDIVPAMIDIVEDRHSGFEVVAHAVAVLRAMGPDAAALGAVPVLISALTDRTWDGKWVRRPKCRRMAAEALGEMATTPETAKKVLAALELSLSKDPEEDVRMCVLASLGSIGTEAAGEAVLRFLLHAAAPCRLQEAAIKALRGMGRGLRHSDVPKTLLNVLHSKADSPANRAAAASTLGVFCTAHDQVGKDVLAGLLRALGEDKAARVRVAVVEALGGMAVDPVIVLPDEAMPALEAALASDPEDEVRRHVMWLLGEVKHARLREWALPLVVRAVSEDPSATVRTDAIEALARLTAAAQAKDDAAPGVLVHVLATDKSAYVRRRAAGALGSLDRSLGAKATHSLVRSLSMDDDAEVRKLVAEALSTPGRGKELEAQALSALLTAMQRDPAPEIRVQVAELLSSSELPAAMAESFVSALLHMLRHDRDPCVRREAAVRLGRLGERRAVGAGGEEEVRRRLREAVEDDQETPDVRREAEGALGALLLQEDERGGG